MAAASSTLILEAEHRTEQRFDRPELDILRFGAFFIVFLSHAFERIPVIVAAGGYGVDLFFALSSYLLTTLLLKEEQKTGRIDVWKFYVRRGLRIWPLYLFFLVIVVPIAHFAISDHLNRWYLVAFLVGCGNWMCVARGFPASIAAPLWSVSVEEQFYFVLPFAMCRFLHRLPQISIGLLFLSNATRLSLVANGASHTAVWCNTFARLDPIAGGLLLAYFLQGKIPAIPNIVRVLFITSGLASLAIAGAFGDASGPRCLWTYPLVMVAVLGILWGFLGTPLFSIAGGWRNGLRYLGKISYGLYVYHMGALKVCERLPFHSVFAFLLTIMVAAVSYRYLEEPFLKLKERFAVIKSRPV